VPAIAGVTQGALAPDLGTEATMLLQPLLDILIALAALALAAVLGLILARW
jgi:hypothetical protein